MVWLAIFAPPELPVRGSRATRGSTPIRLPVASEPLRFLIRTASAARVPLSMPQTMVQRAKTRCWQNEATSPHVAPSDQPDGADQLMTQSGHFTQYACDSRAAVELDGSNRTLQALFRPSYLGSTPPFPKQDGVFACEPCLLLVV